MFSWQHIPSQVSTEKQSSNKNYRVIIVIVNVLYDNN